ncbi:MAG: TIGR02186 family protein [Rhodobacteraceae bacterium]|nr:TIGR02186 family protein [Paracoccaceae bacterium]
MRLRLALALALMAATPAAAERLVTGLSEDNVSITASFDGSDILIYGAVKREEPIPGGPRLEVIVTVEGPSTPVVVRRKDRRWGIWVNTQSVTVDSAPSFYEVATTGPLGRILSETEDLRHKISIPRKVRSVGAPQDVTDSQAFTDALIRLKEEKGAYELSQGAVELSEQTLFRTDIALPANLTEGAYETRIFLLRDRKVIDRRSEIIQVRKVGLERMVYRIARDFPVSNGILALVIAALAGWGASVAFRYVRS